MVVVLAFQTFNSSGRSTQSEKISVGSYPGARVERLFLRPLKALASHLQPTCNPTIAPCPSTFQPIFPNYT